MVRILPGATVGTMGGVCEGLGKRGGEGGEGRREEDEEEVKVCGRRYVD